jgi:pyruvate carboxylase
MFQTQTRLHRLPGKSVIDMLSGGLGQPDGGWPADVQKVVLGNKKATTKRPGELAEPVDLDCHTRGTHRKTRPGPPPMTIFIPT